MKYVFNIILTAIMIVLVAFTVHQLWAWFIVPLGMKQIGMAHAYGLSIIVMYFKHRGSIGKKDNGNSYSKDVMLGIIFNLTTLLTGYIVAGFM